MCAGIFPTIHVGRPWLDFWLLPYPNQRAVWTNFRSPLLWDVFAISTYFAVSAMFWYLGLVPDLASMRDRTTSRIRKPIYTALALGWRGAASHWRHFEKAYLLLAGLATGLVLSVHSVVSFDFADLGRARLAHDDLPALLRRGRHLRRLRDGGARDGGGAGGDAAQEPHHEPAPRGDEQGDPRHVLHHGLQLRDGGLHGVVLR